MDFILGVHRNTEGKYSEFLCAPFSPPYTSSLTINIWLQSGIFVTVDETTFAFYFFNYGTCKYKLFLKAVISGSVSHPKDSLYQSFKGKVAGPWGPAAH